MTYAMTDSAVLNEVLREDFNKQGTIEQRPERGNEESHVDI